MMKSKFIELVQGTRVKEKSTTKYILLKLVILFSQVANNLRHLPPLYIWILFTLSSWALLPPRVFSLRRWSLLIHTEFPHVSDAFSYWTLVI